MTNEMTELIELNETSELSELNELNETNELDESQESEETDEFNEPVAKRGSLIRACLGNDQGVAVVEVILILVVLIALVIIFRNQIVSLVQTIWKSINDDAQDLL